MILTATNRAIGRRNFLQALAGTPALTALGTAPMIGPVHGGPVRLGVIGVGGQGRALLAAVNPAFGHVVAIADVNPASLQKADDVLATRRQRPARHYVEFADMLEHEDIEAVIVAVPLWAHAEVVAACFDAGKHVLCEKMMAFDVTGCERMMAAARRSGKVFEIGYQRNYSPLYRAAYDGIISRHLLGDVHHVRLAWHRNGSWRRSGAPPYAGYDPSSWGYPTFEHLWNWRLYFRYSRGLFAELASHQLNAVNWFLGTAPHAVMASGGVHRFNDGRESYDHEYAIWEYPGGLTTTFSSIESNAFDERYEAFFGTRATLVMYNEAEALLFDEGAGGRATGVEISGTAGGAAAEASETKPANAGHAERTADAAAASTGSNGRTSATEIEISRFCTAIRTGQPIACGAERAFDSARSCIAAHEAIQKQTRITI
jgi:predicted dehydrogenase